MNNNTKVFGIGFQKTATSTLAAALYILGYNVTGYFGPHDPNIAENVYDNAFKLADRFDAAQDTPWPVIFKELDARYPNSKFVLTIRDTDKWVKSVVKHFKKRKVSAHQWIYGVPYAKGYEDAYIKRYEAHNSEVLEYFKERPEDLLVMDITKGDGWEKLCPFLNKEIPCVPFPAQNKATEKSRQLLPRGINFIKRKLTPNYLVKEKIMADSVSPVFIRDILHYHYAMYEALWDSINKIEDQQFTQDFSFYKASICDILKQQINLEEAWLLQIGQNPSSLPLATDDTDTKAEVNKLWQTNQIIIRNQVANMGFGDFNSKLPDDSGQVWESFIELTNKGTENRAKISNLLEQFDVDVEEKSFVEFFNP